MPEQIIPEPASPDDNEPPSLADTMQLFRGPLDVRSFTLTGLFILATFYTIFIIRSFLLPIVFALLLSFLLAPMVKGLKRLRLPNAAAAGLVMLVVLGGIGAVGYGLVKPATAWMQTDPQKLHDFKRRLFPLTKPLERFGDATSEVEKMTTPAPDAKVQLVKVQGSPVRDLLLTGGTNLIVGAVSMFILLFFLLTYGDLFLRKLVKVLPTFQDKKRAVEIAREIEGNVSMYLATVTAINVVLGLIVAVAMWLMGMPNPLLWGVLAGVMNFVPYLGAIVSLIVIAVVALLSFDQVWYALTVPAVFFCINMLEAYVLTPIIVGRRLTLNPVMIFIGLMFWGWLWGIPGTFLAVPILAAFKIFCDHIKPLAAIGEFLGEERQPAEEASTPLPEAEPEPTKA
jgi:predicted PurR-regulated permease PerM